MSASTQLVKKTAKGRKSSEKPQGVKHRSRRKILKVTPDQYPTNKLSHLPEGIEYVGDQKPNPRFAQLKMPATNRGKKAVVDDDADDIVRIGQFNVNVGLVSKDSIKEMRTYLPMEEYRLLKNRKSARMCRQRRKNERCQSDTKIEQLKEVNKRLRQRVADLEMAIAHLATVAQPIEEPARKRQKTASGQLTEEKQKHNFLNSMVRNVPHSLQNVNGQNKPNLPTQSKYKHPVDLLLAAQDQFAYHRQTAMNQHAPQSRLCHPSVLRNPRLFPDTQQMQQQGLISYMPMIGTNFLPTFPPPTPQMMVMMPQNVFQNLNITTEGDPKKQPQTNATKKT